MHVSTLLFDQDILSVIYVTCVDVRCSSCCPGRIHVLHDTNSFNSASGGFATEVMPMGGPKPYKAAQAELTDSAAGLRHLRDDIKQTG